MPDSVILPDDATERVEEFEIDDEARAEQHEAWLEYARWAEAIERQERIEREREEFDRWGRGVSR